MTLRPNRFGALLLAVITAPSAVAEERLLVGSTNGPAESTVLMPVTVDKTAPVVGVQFELNYPASHSEAAAPSVEGSSDHLAVAEDDGEGVLKVVVFSRSNAVIPNDLKLRIPLDLGSTSPAGGPSVSVSEVIFTDAEGNSFLSSISYPLVELWRRANFTEEERANPLIIGDNRDPDGDLVPNLWELLTGGDPHVLEPAPVPFEVEEDGQGNLFLSLTFNVLKDPSIRTAIEVRGETSVDMKNWTSGNVTLTPTGVEDATSEELEAKVLADPGVDPDRFLRVSGTRTEGN